MNERLQTILNIIQDAQTLSDEQKDQISKLVKESDKEFAITQFKFDRTEKLKRTTAVLLEQTIEELEQKRKAVEVQNRELTIETALEKVRARTMAMQRSDELPETSNVLFQQLKELGEIASQVSIGIINEIDEHVELSATVHGNPLIQTYKIPFEEPFVIKKVISAFKENKKSISIKLEGDEVKGYNNWRNSFLERKINFPEEKWIVTAVFFSKGFLSFSSEMPCQAETLQLLERFAHVFDGTYTRFLDLKNAEAQKREAQIEAALERVRAKAMAMHKSEDLNPAVAVVFDELEKLNRGILRCGIAILDRQKPRGDIWTTLRSDLGNTVQISGDEPLDYHPMLLGAYDAWVRQEDFSYVLQDEELVGYYQAVKQVTFQQAITESFHTAEIEQRQYYFNAVFQEGSLFVFQQTALTDEVKMVIKRFANVFNLTYKRFLDLQKAEAQAREAQIEAALERVRSKAMAMHKTEDLNSAVAVVFEELEKLDVGVLRCGISVLDKEKRTGDVWLTSTTDKGPAVQVSGDESFDIHPLLAGAFDAWLRQEDFYYLLEGDDLTAYYKAVKTAQFELPQSQFVSSETAFRQQYCFVAVYHAGGLFAFRETEFPEEAKKVMKRFANVFDLTYKRFLDLQRAEANARESQIEAAMERVRGKAMAMHNTNDLSSAISTAFTELSKLGISPIRFGVGLISDESRKAQLYSAATSAEGDSIPLVGWVILADHPVLEEVYESWLKKEDIFPELSGDQLKSFYEQLLSGFSVPSVPNWQRGEKQFGHFFPFSVGCLYAWAENRFNDVEVKILKRFASIIDLTLRRYMDLQKSEANTKEAVKQAALDRVRAEIASMRTVNDLDKITPLIWNELNILGVTFIRCGVFIMDEDQKLIHTFLSTPDGKAIAAFHLPYTTAGNIPKVLENWRTKSIYTDHWDEAAFTGFAGELVKQGSITSTKQYLSTLPQGGFYLHFFPFLQGMLYVGSLQKLIDDEIKLIQAVANAFSTAYARYEDFNKLEAAKQQVEKTLVDLKQTQQQLVQSEKMASLGELTAGIAHEIQNPLNFVNNFSEVSTELIEEMKVELENGNKDEAMTIVTDVKQNLEKILHHGKRADAIVKSMLQHSRSSGGKKEPTDINALADEYLRLAYHGLRAKDKTFNAKFESHLDNTIGKVEVVPQEIGRVILNLINNAFYAVSEKKKVRANGYEPAVTVTTKNFGDKISITVNDNGNGIPQKILDKIFQPFFTTKPTGEGTGLGLSLSYDIITKGHGGELKVQTKEGEGSEFIIQLPNS